MLKLAVTTTVKNDYYFIEDFINYYKKIGFDKIIIFDDGSSKKFLQIISKYSFVSVIEKTQAISLMILIGYKKLEVSIILVLMLEKDSILIMLVRFYIKTDLIGCFSCDTDEFIGSFRDGIDFNLKEKLKKFKSATGIISC